MHHWTCYALLRYKIPDFFRNLLGVPNEILSRAKQGFTQLSKLTTRRSNRKEYLARLAAVRRIIAGQVLLEVANSSQHIIFPPALPMPEILIPEIPGLTNQLIPNSLLGWLPQMKEFLSRNAYDRNVFVMVSYAARLRSLIEAIKATLVELELNPVVARDHVITDDLNNPVACLLCCNYGVAIFDRPERNQKHNPNVVYELGMMQLLKKPCVILKHRVLERMPTDLLSRLYEDYETPQEATANLKMWWEKQQKS